MRNGVSKCIVFYDWKGDISLSTWLEIAFKLFEMLGVSPNKILGGSRADKCKELSESDINKIKNSKNSKTKVLQIYKTLPEYKQLIFGWDVYMSLDTSQLKTMTFCFNDELKQIASTDIEGLASDLARECSLTYGIVYERGFNKGPELYALGMSSGLGYSDDEMKEANEIGFWMNERMAMNRHLSGCFRDIYEVNFICTEHLKKELSSTTVKEWISKNNCGELTELSSDFYMWSLNKEQIIKARNEFSKNQLLIKDGI